MAGCDFQLACVHRMPPPHASLLKYPLPTVHQLSGRKRSADIEKGPYRGWSVTDGRVRVRLLFPFPHLFHPGGVLLHVSLVLLDHVLPCRRHVHRGRRLGRGPPWCL